MEHDCYFKRSKKPYNSAGKMNHMSVFRKFPGISFMLTVICAIFHSIVDGGELTFGIGHGIIGKGDLPAYTFGTGARQIFLKYFCSEVSLNGTFGEKTTYWDENCCIPLERKLPLFEQHYAIQSDISIGLATPRLFSFQVLCFGGMTPIYASHIGADAILIVDKNVPGGIVLWETAYWKNNGFSLGYHYGIRLDFNTRRFAYGIKGIFKTDGYNTWALAIFEFGYKCFSIDSRICKENAQ